MEIRSESRLHHSVDKVFEAYRDRLPEVAAFVPDIREINVLSRKEDGDTVTLHNEWVSDRDVPKVASKILKPEHLRWDDFATWHTSDHHCEWVIKMRAFTDAVDCSGTTRLVGDGDATRVVLQGTLDLDLRDIPGVPAFLGSRLAPQIEKFIVSLITPNLERTNAAIGRFLDSQG
ncbi:MAG: DUF2505 family protein [Alphaproteobacteria bacterium]|nr:DUF2505 family protein [Alphaproteobacteria bacterium]